MIFILTLIFITLLVGCGPNEPTFDSETITIEHELGIAEIPKHPERIVAFDYGVIDTLRTLGIDIIGLPKSNVPQHLSEFNDPVYEDVGTLFEPNFEKIFEINPDVILISGRQSEVYEELQEIAPTVFVNVDQQNFIESVKQNLRLIGSVFEMEEVVEKHLNEIQQLTDALHSLGSSMSEEVLILMANDGNLSVYGEGSRFGVIHSDFGLKAADKGIEVANHGQSVSFEYLAKINPDYLLVIDRAAITGGSVHAKQTLDNEMIRGMRAYENHRILYLNSELWYVVTGGIESVKEMITELYEGLNATR